MTPAGRLAARIIIHAVSLDRDRRTSAGRSRPPSKRMARAREHDVTAIAFPALGTGVGGYPIDEAARIALGAVRDELRRSPSIEVVTLALRGAAAYGSFERALHGATRCATRPGGTAGVGGG